MSLKVVKVNWKGVGSDGEDYHFHAAPEPVAKGYMINVPTLIQYPDGKIAEGNQVKITPAGLEFFRREFPVGERDAQGRA
ncbi:hypothetical protein [Brucella sp. 191011898]|uniref:hypothetical protein n=1 Tax=Brucella sp. 191011898 TaxID=2730447 RepID=UPI0015DDC3EC|nr:hypothetical protein [Brucella sp. 191011898]CAB4324930.1 hypothetical protein BCH_00144 [Brucella sp. 191011898]